ncbi:odorant receptor 131-2-like [Scomber japonicus]|uniref:odorant receptor 131-2-like n=1 Tax=Scomber japonicus TaxID=13676 RepID=UPI002305EE92|nr:odorant receptor 131-2-like [Scomber japonicus]
MNFSSANSYVRARDSFSVAVSKNVIVGVLCIIINYINGTLIHTFNKHQIFHVNPRYILFIHLVVNDMMQLTSSVMLLLLSYVFYKISVRLCCFLLLFTIIATQNTPMNLAAMAVECYIAICLPLHHATLCTVRRTYILIGIIWFVSLMSYVPDIFLLLSTESAEFLDSKIVCIRNNAFLSPLLQQKNNIYNIILLVIVWSSLVYTYLRILFAAKSADADVKKARNTILLHGFQLLLSMLTYVAQALRQALYVWFPRNITDAIFVCYVFIQVLPRLISPIVYGIRDRTFRRYLQRYLLCGMRASINPQPTIKELQ